MTAAILPFQYQGTDIRVHTDDAGEPWFVVRDVALALEYSGDNLRAIARKVPDSHKGGKRFTSLDGRDANLLCVDEPGLYRLVLRSDKPKAEPFMEWVTAEVLPAIRKTGYYSVDQGIPLDRFDLMQNMLDVMREHDRRIGAVEGATQHQGQQIGELRHDVKVLSLEQQRQQRRPKSKALTIAVDQTTLDIDPPAAPQLTHSTNTGSRKREHDRKGHWFTRNGNRYWRSACRVGGKAAQLGS